METNITQEGSENLPLIKLQQILITSAIVITAIFAILIFYYISAFANVNIYNVSVGQTNLKGLSKEDAAALLNKIYLTSDGYIEVESGGTNKKISFKEIELKYDIPKTVANAYSVGREKGLVGRFFDITIMIFKNKNIGVEFYYNKEKLNNEIGKFAEAVQKGFKEDSYEIKDNRLYFSYGHGGIGVDSEEVLREVIASINNGKTDKLVFIQKNIEPNTFDFESIPKEPKDATLLVENFKIVKYTNETYGVIFDKEEFKRLYDENKRSRLSFSIPVKLINPKVTVEELKQNSFKDVLATYETNYSTSTQNRKENIRLAASFINNMILMPGQEFSYNGIVGPRTIDRGFKLAHAYSNGKVVDDVGGGICQVSTTLYNAVLKIGLEVTERKNHMFTVSYVPVGMDATVNYGTIDFKFKNTLDIPIKVMAETTNDKLKFDIMGSEQVKEENVSYSQVITKVIPYTTEEVADATLEQGKTVIDQHGFNGYNVNVYKITKKDNKVINQELMTKNYYQPLKQIVRKGTKTVNKPVENNDTVPSPTINRSLYPRNYFDPIDSFY